MIILSKKHRVRRHIALFRPILPGANLQDRLVACCGALLGIALTGLLCHNLLSSLSVAPALVAPMGASAVLLFAVPASPLAQPWPIIGGNTLSALVGVLIAAVIPDPMVAGAVAVALAIVAMSLTRCLHPPGGAAALTAVLGGPAVATSGLGFAFFPVAVNSVLLVAAGWLFHRYSGHSYPHVPAIRPATPQPASGSPQPQLRGGVTASDVDDAIQKLGEALDVSREDLGMLLAQAELNAMERLHAEVACRDVMSTGVVAVTANSSPDIARAQLIAHAFHALPVVDERNVVVGAVGHAQLAQGGARVADVMASARLEAPDTPAFKLLGDLSEGRTREVMIVDDDGKLLGVITQTDLLMVLARSALSHSVPGESQPRGGSAPLMKRQHGRDAASAQMKLSELQ
ncbi:HPP family protein [Azospirillum soli]|uniref:HPP family protein n=1 Tax=Azospirillum soli TaxID=1304799 RepID=UPI001FE61651|nr:HPP family protein [Azospirillum soli]MBP2316347.1 CBS domain-containing membrane protein [Azospirillum soli]